jgi:hypothetical protein
MFRWYTIGNPYSTSQSLYYRYLGYRRGDVNFLAPIQFRALQLEAYLAHRTACLWSYSS